MHYRQTIIDQIVTALDLEPTLTGRVSSSNAYPADVAEGVAVRVFARRESRDAETEIMDSNVQPRVLDVQIVLTLSGHDVQRTGNEALETIEGALPASLVDFSDCSYLESLEWDVEADQDRESYSAVIDYSVYYVTVLGDPATRV